MDNLNKKHYVSEPIRISYQNASSTPYVWNGDYINGALDTNFKNSKKKEDLITDGWIKPFMVSNLNSTVVDNESVRIRDEISIIGFLYVYKYEKENSNEIGKPIYRYAKLKEPMILDKPTVPKNVVTFATHLSNESIAIESDIDKDFNNATINHCGEVVRRNDFNDAIEGYLSFEKCAIEFKTRRRQNNNPNDSVSVYENENNYSSIVGIQLKGRLEYEVSSIDEHLQLKKYQTDDKSWDDGVDNEFLDLQIEKLKNKMSKNELKEQNKFRLNYLMDLKKKLLNGCSNCSDDCKCEDDEVRNEKMLEFYVPDVIFDIYWTHSKEGKFFHYLVSSLTIETIVKIHGSNTNLNKEYISDLIIDDHSWLKQQFYNFLKNYRRQYGDSSIINLYQQFKKYIMHNDDWYRLAKIFPILSDDKLRRVYKSKIEDIFGGSELQFHFDFFKSITLKGKKLESNFEELVENYHQLIHENVMDDLDTVLNYMAIIAAGK